MPIPHHLCPTFPSIPANDPSASNYRGKIVVVGAGVSGVSAAISLRRMGFTNVAVLEASGNAGGRLKSSRRFVGDNDEEAGCCSLDVGAEWIHSSYDRGSDVLQRIARFGDEEEDDNDEKCEGAPPELIPYRPTWHFRSRPSWLLPWLYEETKFKSTTWHEWFESTLYKQVKDCVALDSPVVKIDYRSSGEDHRGVLLTLRDGSTLAADRVICTVPLAVLKEDRISFSPGLPPPMQKSIEAIQMPPGFRILFRMKERFYNDLTSLGTLFDLIKDGDDLTFVYDPLLGKDIQNVNVIAYVAIGHKNAGSMSKLNDKDLARAALEKIDGIYGGKATSNLIGSPVVQNWTAEEHIRGAYTFPCKAKLRSELAVPLTGQDGKNAVFFAGEHTSPAHHSLVPGAACEGRRAALEVLASL